MVVAREPSTVDQVYDWAVERGIPAPDAFACVASGLGGKELRLRASALIWQHQVANRKTGFPAIDDRPKGEKL